MSAFLRRRLDRYVISVERVRQTATLKDGPRDIKMSKFFLGQVTPSDIRAKWAWSDG